MGLLRGLGSSQVRGGWESRAVLSARRLGQLTAVSTALAGRGSLELPPRRSLGSVPGGICSAGCWSTIPPACLFCQAPWVVSYSSLAAAAAATVNSLGKNTSSARSIPAVASVQPEMVLIFGNESFWPATRESTSWFWEKEGRAHGRQQGCA